MRDYLIGRRLKKFNVFSSEIRRSVESAHMPQICASVPTPHEPPTFSLCPVLDLPVRNCVLVAEDNDMVAGLLCRIVERMGLVCLRAVNGAQCEALLARHEAEIALAAVDCRLPDMDGVALALQLRRRMDGLPILLMSGSCPSQARNMLTAADIGFLPKPFLPSQVEERMAALLRTAV